MKTIYKIIFILLAILAAVKMFAGGGVSKEAAKKQVMHSVEEEAEEYENLLLEYATKSTPLTNHEIDQIRSIYAIITINKLYESPTLKFNAHLGAAFLFNHPALIEALGNAWKEDGDLLVTTQNLRDALTNIMNYETKWKLEDRSACWNAIIAIMEEA